MNAFYTLFPRRIWLALVSIGLLNSQVARAQSIPDAQWARLGKTLAITTDGNIVTTETVVTPTVFSSLNIVGDKTLKYSLQGDKIQETSPIKGGFYIGGKIPGYDYEVIGPIQALAGTTDGGIGLTGRTSLRAALVPSKINAGGVARQWEETDIIAFGSENTLDDVVGTPDGGFLVLFTNTPTNTPKTITIRKYNANSSFAWSKQIAYPNPPSPDNTLTKGEAVINTPDGGFLVVGYYNTTGTVKDLNDLNAQDETGWVAKLDGAGTVLWQKLLDKLPIPANISGNGPGPITKLNAVTDVMLAADGNGYVLAGIGQIPSAMITAPPVSALLELDWNGNFKRSRSLGMGATKTYITAYTDPDGTKYYAVGNTSRANGADPQIAKVSTAALPLTDPGLLKVVAQRTFDGPSDGFLTNIATAGDGSLVFVTTAIQVVKLITEKLPPSPGGSLTLLQPTYNCQTGAIVFNSSGGNGSPIFYTAPGISRANQTDNFGTVETGLRNDPKPILIQATQNGQTTSFLFDLAAFCSGTQPPQPPVPPQPPTGSLTLLQPTYNCQTGAIVFNSSGGNGSPIFYTAPGISRANQTDNFGTVETGLRNDPKPILIQATQNGQTASFLFDLAAFCSGTQPPQPPVPPSGSLQLLAPTYNCSTGAIHFNTSGGNGSVIEFMASGITGWTTNPDQFVDQDSRTANDVKPFQLMARQSGQLVSYTWDLKAACGRARLASDERPTGLQVFVLGNPIEGKTAEVAIKGASGQVLQVNLLDLQGRLLHQTRIDQAGVEERLSVPISNATGILLLHVSTPAQRKQIKLLKL